MNVDRLIEDVRDLLAMGDRLAAKTTRCSYGGRGQPFYKTPYGDALRKAADDGDDDGSNDGGDEPNAHAKTKAQHHEAMPRRSTREATRNRTVSGRTQRGGGSFA